MRSALGIMLAAFALLCVGLGTSAACAALTAIGTYDPIAFSYSFVLTFVYIGLFALFGLSASKLLA